MTNAFVGIAALLALAGALVLPGCAPDEPVDPLADALVRERAAAHASKGNYGSAREVLAPLAARDPSMGGNPKPATVQQLRDVFLAALHGRLQA